MRLSTIQEIERAIDELTPEQMEELYEWLEQRHPQPIDAQLEADLDVLDGLANGAVVLAALEARPYPDVDLTPPRVRP